MMYFAAVFLVIVYLAGLWQLLKWSGELGTWTGKRLRKWLK